MWEEVLGIVVGALILGSNDRNDLAGAGEDNLRSPEIRNRAQVGATRDAVDFNRTAIVGVGQKIGNAQEPHERHQDAHADSATPEGSFAHVLSEQDIRTRRSRPAQA